jgi:hypothetical protein
MAVLSEDDRLKIWRGIMRYGSKPDTRQIWDGLTKPDLRAAVDAADNWADANAASFNAALPIPFRTNATSGQKALLLALVVLARYNPSVIRTVVGDVD